MSQFIMLLKSSPFELWPNIIFQGWAKSIMFGLVGWSMSINPLFWTLRQEDWEFRDDMSYILKVRGNQGT